MKKKIKVAVAMSGGVDSGVAAKLLVEQGYQVAGIHMRLWSQIQNSKFKIQNLKAAEKTANFLGIPFQVVDFSKIFKKKVVDYFLEKYAAGLTPNPCVMCNKFIKFGELLDYIRKEGFDYLATGHYARLRARKSEIRNPKSEIYHLLMARDKSKDQSYFLYNLTQSQLSHILFPVGNYTKKQVRQMAKNWKLPVAKRPESQEICFLAGKDYRSFLKRKIADKIRPGEVIDTQSHVIGCHSGILLYTIGQRHGFEIKDKKTIGPLYVIEKNAKKNQLIVGFGKETERKEFWVKNINLIYDLRFKIDDLRVRIRSQGELLKCKITSKKLKVILEESERGIAPGQAAVFYGSTGSPQAYEVLGGGIIDIDKR